MKIKQYATESARTISGKRRETFRSPADLPASEAEFKITVRRAVKQSVSLPDGFEARIVNLIKQQSQN